MLFFTLLVNYFMTQTQNINQFSNNTGVWGHSLFTWWSVYTMIDVKPTVSERHLQTSTYQCSELLWTRRTWWTRWDWRGAPGRPVDHVQQLLLLWPVRSGRKHFASSRLFIDVLVLSNHIPPRFVLSNSRLKRNSLALVYETDSTVYDSTLRLMNSNMKNKWGFLFFALMWLFWMNLYDLSNGKLWI